MGLTDKKISFYVQSRSSQPKIDSHVISAIFKQRKSFYSQNSLDVLMRKEQQHPPPPPDSSILLAFG